MLRIAQIVGHSHKCERLVSSSMVYIRKPTHAFYSNEFATRLVNPPPGGVQRILLRDFKLTISTVYSRTHPHFICHNQRKRLFICYGIDISYDYKLFIGFRYPGKKLTEKRERRIGDDDVGLISQSRNLCATEIPITIKVFPLQVVNIYMTVTCDIAVKDKYFAVCLGLVHIELRR